MIASTQPGSNVTVVIPSNLAASICGVGRVDIGIRYVKAYNSTGTAVERKVLRSKLPAILPENFFKLVDAIQAASK